MVTFKRDKVFDKCCAACICNTYDEQTIPDSFSEDVSPIEQTHRLSIQACKLHFLNNGIFTTYYLNSKS